MSDAPDNHALDRRIAVLEERMETQFAKTESAIDRLRAEMAERDAARSERDAARSERDAARSERDATARWWQTAIIVAAISVALGVAGLIF